MRFPTFILGLAVTFGAPWYFLVVKPYQFYRDLEPVAFDEEKDERSGMYPEGTSGAVAFGEMVFKREGCVQCHTQVIRPSYAGMDTYKADFGKGGAENKGKYTRSSLPWDYSASDNAPIGLVRIGPDLSNVGYRHPETKWHHKHLFDPRSINEWSTMPSFAHLYEKKLLRGKPSEEAVSVYTDEDTGSEYQVLPTYNAEALVQYLQSRKLSDAIPASLKPEVAAAPAAK